MKKNTSLISALGYEFHDPTLLDLALRHPSLGPCNNQRLEFLGDAVLQLAISKKLYTSYPDAHEGQLTSMRQALVREETLADIARELNIGEYLQMDHGCRTSGVSNQDGALSDAMESVLAAVYLDGCGPKKSIFQRTPKAVCRSSSRRTKSRCRNTSSFQTAVPPTPEALPWPFWWKETKSPGESVQAKNGPNRPPPKQRFKISAVEIRDEA